MLRCLHRFLALFLGLGPVLLHGEDDWSDLKLGMTAEETIATLGRPLLRTTGRGFETWIYDNGAEVLLYGSLVGWTAPASARVVERSVDVWRENRSGTYFPTFLALLPKPVAKSSAPEQSAGSSGGSGNITWLPIHVYRRR